MKASQLEEVLNLDYHIGCKIGSGGFGKVYLATHVVTLQKVAVKVMIKRKLGVSISPYFHLCFGVPLPNVAIVHHLSTPCILCRMISRGWRGK
jgi:serine/threonine protein kinase